MEYKTALGVLSIAIGIVAYAIYFWQTAKREGVQPHPFSWFLWGMVTAVAYLVQRGHGGGAGSWVTAFTGMVCFAIGGVSLRKRQGRFSGFDWIALGTGLGVFAFYLLARDPTLSAVLATVIDLVGFGPTFRKGWIEPHKDSATSFGLNGIKFVPAVFALQSYSLASCLFPTTLVIVNVLLAIMLVARRWQIAKQCLTLPNS